MRSGLVFINEGKIPFLSTYVPGSGRFCIFCPFVKARIGNDLPAMTAGLCELSLYFINACLSMYNV